MAVGDGVCVAGTSVAVGVGGSGVTVDVAVGTGVGGAVVVGGGVVDAACTHPLRSSDKTVRVMMYRNGYSVSN